MATQAGFRGTGKGINQATLKPERRIKTWGFCCVWMEIIFKNEYHLLGLKSSHSYSQHGCQSSEVVLQSHFLCNNLVWLLGEETAQKPSTLVKTAKTTPRKLVQPERQRHPHVSHCCVRSCSQKQPPAAANFKRAISVLKKRKRKEGRKVCWEKSLALRDRLRH